MKAANHVGGQITQPAMSDPLAKTFELLATTANVNAADVLVAGLDSTFGPVKEASLQTLFRRRSARGHVEAIRRLESLTPGMREILELRSREMEHALRQCLIHGDRELRTNALEIIRFAECYNQTSTLMDMLQNDRVEFHEVAAETVDSLAHSLYCRLYVKDNDAAPRKFLRNLQHVRHHVLTALSEACDKPAELHYADHVIEAILSLGDPEHFAVRKVLLQAKPAYREEAGHQLMTSKHPGVMQLICDCMSKNYPPAKVFQAIQQREDPEFICHMLNWFPKRLSQLQHRNFQQITSIVWLDSRAPQIDHIPVDLQESLVSFVLATGLPSEQKTELREWLVRHGSPQARLAAGEVLKMLAVTDVNTILFDGLDDEDPRVQAWATSQLRSHGIPEAFRLLVERLDSPLEPVRDAARKQLQGFDLQRMLTLYDHLDHDTCLRAGVLLQKIDPDCLNRLRREMANPVRGKRIRAVRAAVALGVQQEVFSAITTMLEDSDAYVRRVGVEVLGTLATRDAIQALQNVTEDPSPRVREAVQQALEQIRETRAATGELL